VSNTLTGKTALVTGASKGIGAGIALALAEAGASVIVNYANDHAGAEATIAAIEANGDRAWAVQGDVSKPEDIARMFREVGQRHDQLDILVNNAGVYRAQPLEELTPEDFHFMYDVNVLGLLLVTQAALPLFNPEGGSIVNIGAISGRMASPGIAAYAGSKGAVDTITLSLSKELGPRKIRVNAINPGSIQTPGLADSGFMQDVVLDRVMAGTPMARLGHPEDIADAVVFLASDKSRWIDGQIIAAAGGLTY
jgi:3-oxoacyl-[acyl-carrier protein] reductase